MSGASSSPGPAASTIFVGSSVVIPGGVVCLSSYAFSRSLGRLVPASLTKSCLIAVDPSGAAKMASLQMARNAAARYWSISRPTTTTWSKSFSHSSAVVTSVKSVLRRSHAAPVRPPGRVSMCVASAASWYFTTASTSPRNPNGGSGKSSNHPFAWLVATVANASNACTSFGPKALTNGKSIPGTIGLSAKIGDQCASAEHTRWSRASNVRSLIGNRSGRSAIAG